MKIKQIKTIEYSLEILKLRNKDYVLKNSIKSKKIKYSEHIKWLKKFLIKNKFFIILHKKGFVGYISLNHTKKNYVSWAVTKKYWGKIKFYRILKKISKKNSKAKIKINNTASLIVALKAGFKIKSFKRHILYLEK